MYIVYMSPLQHYLSYCQAQHNLINKVPDLWLDRIFTSNGIILSVNTNFLSCVPCFLFELCELAMVITSWTNISCSLEFWLPSLSTFTLVNNCPIMTHIITKHIDNYHLQVHGSHLIQKRFDWWLECLTETAPGLSTSRSFPLYGNMQQTGWIHSEATIATTPEALIGMNSRLLLLVLVCDSRHAASISWFKVLLWWTSSVKFALLFLCFD